MSAKKPRYRHDFPAEYCIEQRKQYTQEKLHWRIVADRRKGNMYVFSATVANGKKIAEYRKEFGNADDCLDLYFDVMYEIGNRKMEEEREEKRMGVLDSFEDSDFHVSIAREERHVDISLGYRRIEGCFYLITCGERFLGTDNLPIWKNMSIRFEDIGDGKGRRMALQMYDALKRRQSAIYGGGD